MSIYRGAGGSGDAVNDASSEATLVAQLVVEAQADADAAQASATAAAGSASTASTAATNASNSATSAATSATNASNSASAASTSATNAASSASTATTKASEASTSATNAATSASAASTSATNAASSAATATTQATNASNSATAASTSATNASNSATAASTSATNAASSASSASTSATNAAASASAAGTSATAAAGSATSAAGSATTATTQAGIATTQATNAASSASAASTSATNASNSASAASTSATNASNSASSAATSATNAAASYDSFDDRYLGAKSVAPTLDNDGNTLLVGALYFNTVSNFMKVWDGSSWLDAYASLSNALLASNNLSDLTNTATARTNLGLGTIATQAASNVAITGGTINGTTIGASTASTGRFSDLTDTGLTATRVTYAGTGGNLVDSANLTFDGTTLTAAGLSDSGNLTFTGTGNRILGDFSNTTLTNQVLFQTSTTNGSTQLRTIPNGTGPQTGFFFYDNPDTLNNAWTAIRTIYGSDSRLQSGITGTGTYLPLTMFTGGSERLRIDTTGNVGIGVTSPITGGARLSVRASGDYDAGLVIGSSASANNWARLDFKNTNHANAAILYQEQSGIFGIRTSGATPILLETNATERMRIDSSGNVGIGTTDIYSRFNIQGGIIAGATTGEANGVGALRIIGSPFALSDVNSGIEFKLAGDTNGYGSKIVAISSGGSNIVFANRQASATWTEQMRITPTGNVGIGTSSPNGRLGVVAPASTTYGSFDAPTNGFAYTSYKYAGSDYGFLGQASGIASGNATDFAVRSQNNLVFAAGGGTERMRIDTSGNVGIGTSSPFSAAGWKALSIDGTNQSLLDLKVGGSSTGYIYASAAALHIVNNTATLPIVFVTNSAERMRIDASGQLRTTVTGTTMMDEYGCRAWVNFNGTGTVAIRGSGNVSSITDNGTGDYTVNFTTAMPDANYAANCSTVYNNSTRESVTFFVGTPSTTAIRLVTGYTYTSPGATDTAYLYVSVFR